MGYGDSDEVKESKFNEAAYQMRRFDKLADNINHSRLNPSDWNEYHNTWNYKVMTQCLNSLLAECWGKLTPDEQKRGQRMEKLLDLHLQLRPPHKMVKKRSGAVPKPVFTHDNWESFNILLSHYEKMIKVFMETHNLTSPRADDSGL